MNLLRFGPARRRPDSPQRSQLSKVGQTLAKVRLDPDLAFDTLSQFLNHVGISAASVMAWMLHEDVRTMLHHPLEVAATTSWAGGFFLLSLTARMVARMLRQRHTSPRREAHPFD